MRIMTRCKNIILNLAKTWGITDALFGPDSGFTDRLPKLDTPFGSYYLTTSAQLHTISVGHFDYKLW